MLKQRMIFGALGIVLAISVLTFCPVYIIGICVGVISLIGLYEFYKVTGLIEKKSPALYVGVLFCIAFNVMTIIMGAKALEILGFYIVAFVFLLMLLNVLYHSKCTFKDVSLSFLGATYVTVFFAHMFLIRRLELGSILIWILFVCSWSTDSFAYFCGRAFGKHKLCPKISPKKTIEGAIGGVIACIGFALGYLAIVAKANGMTVNYLNGVILALAASVFSQIGDLVASRIKREYDVKDFGNLIPGHGGILDRFDSALLISPIVYYLLLVLPVIK